MGKYFRFICFRKVPENIIKSPAILSFSTTLARLQVLFYYKVTRCGFPLINKQARNPGTNFKWDTRQYE